MAILTILSMLTIIVIFYWAILYAVSFIVHSSKLRMMALSGIIDAGVTLIIGAFIVGFMGLSFTSSISVDNLKAASSSVWQMYVVEFAFLTNPPTGDNIYDFTKGLLDDATDQLESSMNHVLDQLKKISLYSRSTISYGAGGGTGLGQLQSMGTIKGGGAGGGKTSGGAGGGGKGGGKGGGSKAAAIGSLLSSLFGGSVSFGAQGGYTFFAPFLTAIFSKLNIALMLVYALNYLMELAYSPSLLLTLVVTGIVLRSFGFSKGGGTYLMAFAFTLNAILPAGIGFGMYAVKVFMASSSTCTLESAINQINVATKYTPISVPFVPAPEPFNLKNIDQGVDQLNTTTCGMKYYSIFVALAYALVLGFSLTLIVSGSAGISQLLGADISVFVIGRIARVV